jgi:hypothetical protein
MEPIPDRTVSDYVRLGPRKSLDRFLAEYALTAADVHGDIVVRVPPGAGGSPGEAEYLVHESLLRSHGEFPCAGDAEALGFCREIAEDMVTTFGITQQEAVARINRQWSDPATDGHTPRIWIVGLDIVYHELPEYWAKTIYYGNDFYWWAPGATPTPLPPPT